MRVLKWLFVLVAAIAWLPEAASAQAAFQTYVTQGGDDAASCATPAEPCVSIQAAIDKTRSGGFVYILGTAQNFRGFVVNKSLNIKSQTQAEIFGNDVPSLVIPIKVEVPAAGVVTFENLTFIPRSTLDEPIGVNVTGAGKVTFKNCRFSRLRGPAIDVKGPAGARVVLDGVTITNNGGGVRVKGAGGAGNTVFIQRSMIDANEGYAVQVDGAANNAVISSSTLSGSRDGPDLSLLNGGRTISYQNNVIRSGTPTQTLPTN